MKRLKANPTVTGQALSRILLRFFVAGLLSVAQIFGAYAPFSLGFIAASGAGLPGLAALGGAITGAALCMDFSHILRLAATGILLFSAATSLSGTKLSHRPLFFPVLSSFLAATVELAYLINDRATAAETAACFTSIVLVGFATRYFPHGEDFLIWDKQEAQLPHFFLLACLLMAFNAVPLPLNISLGRIGAGTLIMAVAFQKGSLVGTASGLGIGLMMDLARGGTGLFFAGAYAISAFFLGFQRETGKIFSAILYAVVQLFFLLPEAASIRYGIGYECLFSVILFLLLPLKKSKGKHLDEEATQNTPEWRLRSQLAETARAFEELSMSFPHSSEGEENPAVMYERTAEEVCRHCTMASTCWEEDYEGSYTAFNDATAAILQRGRAEARDFPPYFSHRCTHFPDFLATLNAELSAYLQRQQYRVRLYSARRLAQGQYTELAELLSRTAEAAAVPASAEQGLSYKIGLSLRPKKGESVSGDTVLSFESEDKHWLFLLLSDGMGSGIAAQKESATAVRMLERFLRAGIPAETALKTLHSAMTLRNEESGAFTTVDLLALDLYTGDATLYKYGAAPSYIREGKNVRRIRASNLPVGLDELSGTPDMTQLSLSPGTALLLLSDGIFETEDERWLTALLKNWEGRDPQSLTSLILCDSLDHGGAEDDCAAIALYLPAHTEKV